MKKTTILIIILCKLAVIQSFSQKINNIVYDIDADKNLINIQYTLSQLKYYQIVDIELFYSIDNGKSFNGPLKSVKGDVGLGVKNNGEKSIVWYVFKDASTLSGSLIFEIKAIINEIPRPKKMHLSYTGSLYSPFGLSFGTLNKSSFYATVKSNIYFIDNYNAVTYSSFVSSFNETENYYKFEDNVSYNRFAITAGLNQQLHWDWHIYFGLGYGLYQGLWQYNLYNNNNEINSSKNVILDHYNYKGIETEIGLRYNIKNKVLISLGVNSLIGGHQKNYDSALTDVNLGIGWVFNK